jgi:hypothetical protein
LHVPHTFARSVERTAVAVAVAVAWLGSCSERAICRQACANDAECPAIAPICLGVDGRCVECYDDIGLPCTDPAKPKCTWYLQCKGADEPYL